MNDVNPFDSFAARLRIAQRRAKPAKFADTRANAGDRREAAKEKMLGVRIRFKRNGAPRGGEPYETLSRTQQQSGKLDADGCVRLRIPLSDPEMVIAVGTAGRLRLALSIRRDDAKAGQLAAGKPRIQPNNSSES